MSIIKTQFESYVAVQESGATNMFDIAMVEQLSGLEREDIMDIMENYDKYREQFKPKKTSEAKKKWTKVNKLLTQAWEAVSEANEELDGDAETQELMEFIDEVSDKIKKYLLD